MSVIGLAEALRLKGGLKGFHEALYFCSRDLFGLSRPEFNERWKPKNDSDTGTLRGYTQPTSDALFLEWKLRRDPSWLYSHPEYKWDSVGVSTFQTSATTVGGVLLLRKASADPRRIFDWGAGPGFSSMIMARNHPCSEVHYNEINTDLVSIFTWFKDHARIKNVRHVVAPEGGYDLIQAYEIVEHILHEKRPGVGDPMTETLKVLQQAAPTAFFLHSSCWSAERRYVTLGHFLRSEVRGQIVKNTRVGMHFRAAMKEAGWSIMGAGWNSRPFLFKRDQ